MFHIALLETAFYVAIAFAFAMTRGLQLSSIVRTTVLVLIHLTFIAYVTGAVFSNARLSAWFGHGMTWGTFILVAAVFEASCAMMNAAIGTLYLTFAGELPLRSRIGVGVISYGPCLWEIVKCCHFLVGYYMQTPSHG
jgi:hypothetical protein